jgi:hypothetical protein
MQEVVEWTDGTHAEPKEQAVEDGWKLSQSKRTGSSVRFHQPDGINEAFMNENLQGSGAIPLVRRNL